MSSEVEVLEIDSLFEEALPPRDRIIELKRKVLTDKEEMQRLKDRLEEEQSRRVSGEEEREHMLRVGVALWMLGRYDEAVEYLEPVRTRKDALYFLCRCYLELGKAQEVVEMMGRVVRGGDADFRNMIVYIEALRRTGESYKAIDELEKLAKTHGDEADLHYQLGLALFDIGEYESALNSLERALELDPNHAAAAFYLGYINDLRGNDDDSVRYYEAIKRMPVFYPNALINLGVIYEDRGEYYKAIECYHAVLCADPQNERAKLFAQDARASLTMYYDEEKERRADRRSAVLDIPVTDFELSVRSRNCLEKMNIRTLGDLTRVTEAQLLSFKNFGETSLNEIRQMMASKGLRIGQALEEPEEEDEEPFPLPPEMAAERREILNKPVSELNLSVRGRRAMERLGVRTIGDLTQKTEEELLQCKNFGETSIREVKEKLKSLGLSLKESSR